MRHLVGLLLLLGVASCANVKAATPEALRTRLESLRESTAIRGDRVRRAATLRRFYEERKYEPAWTAGSKPEAIVKAIRGIRKDGLDPADYHLESIEALIQKHDDESALADLELLLSDAVASLVDDVRYGRVRPVSLDPAWNVDPREGAPALEQTMAEIASSGSPDEGIEKAKPSHFIYGGLVTALERLEHIAAEGGWPRVPAGKTIKPGARDPRVAAVRARLAVTGELDRASTPDSVRYDEALVKAVKDFQAHHRLEADGLLDATTVEAMNVPAAARAAQVRVNLERSRWVLGGLRDDFLLVNLPAFKAYLIRGGKNVWETRTQIGKEARQTPAFRSDMKTVVFNPDWTVPPTILEEDVLAGMRKGENTIAKKGLSIYDAQGNTVEPSSIDWGSATSANFPYTLRQPPGEDNALGRVKFLFPNKFSIYLHDTPHRDFFEAEKRTFSSGCIRIENPLELAERVLNWSPQQVQEALADGKMQHVAIDNPLPVLIVYWTVSVGASGEVRYMKDVYGLDAKVLSALEKSPGRAANGARAAL